MKYSLTSKLLAIAMCLAVVGGQVACSSSQVVNVVNIVATQTPIALNLANNLITAGGGSNPALTATLTKISGIVATDAPVIEAAIATWKSNQTASNLSALAAVVNSLAATVNAQFLQANSVADPKADAVILASIAGVSTVISGMALALAGVNKTTTPAATAASIGYDDIKGYLSQKNVEQVAATYDVSPEFVSGL